MSKANVSSMADDESTIVDLTNAVIRFRDERNWKQFHNVKDVALSLVLEATELLEIFQWTPENDALAKAKDRHPQVQDELADILYWILLLSHDLGIDIRAALLDKLQANSEKYPIEKAYGSSKKYDEL